MMKYLTQSSISGEACSQIQAEGSAVPVKIIFATCNWLPINFETAVSIALLLLATIDKQLDISLTRHLLRVYWCQSAR
jgi:hypothetical protein